MKFDTLKIITRRKFVAGLNPPKCITNLYTSSLHFKRGFDCYQASFAINEVVLICTLKVYDIADINPMSDQSTSILVNMFSSFMPIALSVSQILNSLSYESSKINYKFLS